MQRPADNADGPNVSRRSVRSDLRLRHLSVECRWSRCAEGESDRALRHRGDAETSDSSRRKSTEQIESRGSLPVDDRRHGQASVGVRWSEERRPFFSPPTPSTDENEAETRSTSLSLLPLSLPLPVGIDRHSFLDMTTERSRSNRRQRRSSPTS